MQWNSLPSDIVLVWIQWTFLSPSNFYKSQIDFVVEKRHMDVLLETPTLPPPLETSRTFFDFAEAPGALFILQPLRPCLHGTGSARSRYQIKYFQNECDS